MAKTDRQKIFDFLNLIDQFDIEPKRIYPAFPEIKKTTVRKYLRDWRVMKQQGQSFPQNNAVTKVTATPPKPQILPTINLPPELQSIVEYTQQAQLLCPSWRAQDTINFFKEQQKTQPSSQSTPTSTLKPVILKRPKEFHPKQHQLVDAVIDPKIKMVFCQGCQRSGKSTGVFQGLHELALSSDHIMRVLLLAGKGGNNPREGGAMRILYDVLRDPILKDSNAVALDWGPSHTNASIKWINGSEIVATELTVASIKGGDNEIVWIDELDVAISQGRAKLEAVVSAINTMLATPDFKLILTANLDKGIYQVLVDAIMSIHDDSVVAISIEKDDCPHLNQEALATNYTIGRTMSNALLGKGFGEMRLEGRQTDEGDVFNAASLKDAFETYDIYMTQGNPDTTFRYMGIDPAGTVHAHGVFVGFYDPVRREFGELESHEYQMGDGTNGTVTAESLEDRIVQLAKKYKIKKACVESNSGGHRLMFRLKREGFQCIMQNFKGAEHIMSHSQFIGLARIFFDNRMIYLQNSDLKLELATYNPEKGKETKTKGDVADAFLHCLWLAVGGVKFIQKWKKEQQDKKARSVVQSAR